MFMRRGHSGPRNAGVRGMLMVVMMAVFVVVMMSVLLVSLRGRGRPRHILLCPIFFPRKILLAVYPNVDFRSRDATSDNSRNFQACAYAQCRHGLFQHARRNSGVDERAQKHVAAHSRKTFKVGNSHVEKRRRSLVVGRWLKPGLRRPASWLATHQSRLTTHD